MDTLKQLLTNEKDLESKTTRELLIKWFLPCMENYRIRVERLQKQIDDMLEQADTVWVMKEKK